MIGPVTAACSYRDMLVGAVAGIIILAMTSRHNKHKQQNKGEE
jgi:hypothetical protein